MAIMLLSGIINIARADVLTLNPVTFTDGEPSQLVFSLDNQSAYYGFQADITLPVGVTPAINSNGAIDMVLSDRFGSGYQSYGNTLSDGTVRVGTFSLNHSPITGNAGELFTLSVNVESEFKGGIIKVTGIKFINSNDKDVNFPSISLSTTVGVAPTQDKIYIEDFSIMEGETKEVSILLDNDNTYTAFQTDITLSPNLTIVPGSFQIASRTVGHTVNEKTVGGITRVTCMSSSNAAISGNSGTILTFSVTAAEATGNATITLSNNLFTSTDIQEFRLADSQTDATIVEPYVTEIQLSVDDTTLMVGQSMEITATVIPANVKDKRVTWSSQSEVIARYSNGEIIAVAPGTTYITASCSDVNAQCRVTVKGAADVAVIPGDGTHEDSEDSNPGGNTASGGSLTGKDLTLRVDQTASLKLQLPTDLTETPEFQWSLANGGEDIVTLVAGNDVSASFTGKAIGETAYFVSVKGSSEVLASGTIRVIGKNPVLSFTINPPSLTIPKNALAQTLTPQFTPESPSNPELIWSSRAESVATVSNGVITPVGQGECTITATTTDGTNLSATCEVKVTDPIAESFEFDFDETVMGGKEGISLYIGDTYKFIPKAQDGYVLPAISWSSSDATTVSVNNDGTISALKLGEAVITASATVNNQEVKEECKVTVIPVPLENVIVTSQTTTSLMDGETVQLTAKTEPINATAPIEIKWSSDKPEIASVNETTGLVTAHATLGTAIITATASNPAEKKVTGSIEVTVIPTGASRIILNSYDLMMMVGQTNRLTGTVEPANTTNPTINWSIDNPKIATIDSQGNITALSAGTATVTATCGVATAQCTVTVKSGGDITVTPGTGTGDGEDDGNGWIDGSDVYVHVNRTVNMNLSMPDGLTDAPTLTWTLAVGGDKFVKLVPAGNTLSAAFTGLSVGETSYTVSLNDEELLSGKVTVIAEVTMNSLQLEPAKISMARNALPQTIKTVYTPENATMPQFAWSSSDSAVATVDQNGKVTPVAQGETTITATALDGSNLNAAAQVTVTAPIAESFEFDFDEEVMGGKEGISLYIGDTYRFEPKAQDGYVLPTIIWTSSDANTVSVNNDGTVTALKLGKATITASATVNGKEVKATCEVTVIPILANNIVLSAENLTLLEGQTDRLTAKVEPETTTDKTVTWSSDNEAIAFVDGEGNITAVSAGTATINASCGDVSAQCTVTVKSGGDITVKPGDGTGSGSGQDDGNGWIDGTDVTVHVNRSVTMNLQMPDDLSVTPTLSWTLANGGDRFVKLTPANNTLSASFTGLSVGETSYTISLNGEELLSGKVTVIAEVTMKSLELEPAVLSMAQNALPVKLATKYTPSDATMPQFRWSSSAPSVASVSNDGTVTPKSQGQTTITATALDGSGLSATCKVNVTAPIDEDFDFDESVMGGVEGVTIFLGESYILQPKAHEGFVLPSNIVWSSSDDKIVSVDQKGKVTGNALGSATIFATAVINGNEITASCTVNVVPIKVSSIKLSQTTAELRATETLKLTVTVEPSNATDKTLQWTTNAPSIVSVSKDGVVTAHMVGEANITARATDGSNVSANCTVKVVPTIATGITVTADGSTTLKATETVQLTATVTPATTTDKSVTWKSDKPDIASVSDSGVVTAVAVGEANITATNSAGQSSTVKITVIPTLVETIELNRYTAQIRVQGSFRLTANIYPLTATDKSVTWSSSNPQIVSVDNEGNVIGIGLGEAQIICTANDGSGITAQCRVTVTTTATQSVSVTANGSTTLKASETVQLTATVLPETASDKSVRWQSDNTDIATVDNRGLVTAVSVGSATITATNSGGQTASISITVVPTPVESIELNKTTATLKASETLLLIATVYPETATQKGIEWSTSDETIATVTQNGLVTAVAKGEAVITAKAIDGSGVTATCKVTVIATDVTSIKITANGSTTLKAAETLQLTATVLPETATDKSVRWSSASPEIADVNENGLVTAYAVGKTIITATAASGLSDEITVTVEPTLISSIILNQPSLTMRVTNEVQLSATILPTTATDKSLTWTSSNASIASVDASGKVTAIKEGQTSIICTANDGSGVAATCIVNVVDTDVEIVTITAEGPTTLKVSETVQLKATVQPETTTDKSIIWSSGNEKVAAVDADGLVTAISEGFAVITATTSNGLKDQITITVVDTQVSSITLNETTIILMANETYSLIPNIQPQTATNKRLHWTTGDASVATVAQDGVVSAIAVGETTVTASATDGSGIFASCKVTVIPTPAESITITVVGSTTLEINQTVQLTAEVLPANATDKSVVWTSSNKIVAEVTENGLVTALTAGETVITATNSAGQYDRVTIIVLSNEPDQPDVPDVPVKRADTPTEMLRKGDGTSHTFVAMMDKSDETLEAEGYHYVFGYTEATDNEIALEDTPWRYTYTTEDIYWNSSFDFWVFAYYIDSEGTLCVSSRRHLDGGVDDGFDPMKFIGSRTRSGEHIVGIYTVEGKYMGKNVELLESGIYVIKTTKSSYKIIK